jgi:hypothetical protein
MIASFAKNAANLSAAKIWLDMEEYFLYTSIARIMGLTELG